MRAEHDVFRGLKVLLGTQEAHLTAGSQGSEQLKLSGASALESVIYLSLPSILESELAGSNCTAWAGHREPALAFELELADV